MKYLLPILFNVIFFNIAYSAEKPEEGDEKKSVHVPEAQEALEGLFPDGITPAALSCIGIEEIEETDSIGTAKTESITLTPSEKRKKRRRKRRKRLESRGIMKTDVSTMPPMLRLASDFSDAEKDLIGILPHPERKLSRIELERARTPIPLMPDHDYTYPVDEEDRPVVECFGAYRDYYQAWPETGRDGWTVSVMWPPEISMDGKTPEWHWGVTNLGNVFVYWGGEDPVKVAQKSLRDRPRAETPVTPHPSAEELFRDARELRFSPPSWVVDILRESGAAGRISKEKRRKKRR